MGRKKNPNMRTRAWGPPAWFLLIMVAMGYPSRNPTARQRREYRNFFISFGHIMPCNLCRTSYKKFLKETPLSSTVLNSRRNLVFWVFKIKNRVNKKLRLKQLGHSELLKKYKYYDSFRATACNNKLGCTRAPGSNKRPKRIKIKAVSDKQAKKK